MMRMCTLAISAGLAVVGGSPFALAQTADQPSRPGTTDRDRNDAHPMDRGVIRPPEHNTVDPNQARVPGTRDNPNAFDRDKGLDQQQGPLPKRKNLEPDRGNDSLPGAR
ncbi:MAG: hypothetical protein JSR91_10185 [Proteobacteria bacterium]|nr:hypothetical protein [Pseudomonadota bacterium]